MTNRPVGSYGAEAISPFPPPPPPPKYFLPKSGGGEFPVLHGITSSFAPGRMTALMGPSGEKEGGWLSVPPSISRKVSFVASPSPPPSPPPQPQVLRLSPNSLHLPLPPLHRLFPRNPRRGQDDAVGRHRRAQDHRAHGGHAALWRQDAQLRLHQALHRIRGAGALTEPSPVAFFGGLAISCGGGVSFPIPSFAARAVPLTHPHLPPALCPL